MKELAKKFIIALLAALLLVLVFTTEIADLSEVNYERKAEAYEHGILAPSRLFSSSGSSIRNARYLQHYS